MFADRYLEKNGHIPLIDPEPPQDLGISIVIPCLREPGILSTLESLIACPVPQTKAEVIVLINHAEDAGEATREMNRATRKRIDHWINQQQPVGISFHAAGPVELRKKWAGAGLARKKGMDEAVARFNRINNPEGIIVSLDADTLVEKNYLTAIESFFRQHPQHVGATLAFSHQTEGLTGKHLQGIKLYEAYMDYYRKALGFCGYPTPLFTVGSAFAVRAGAYVKRGGMNRRKAGEDFYFLQNLTHLGPVGEITATTVHPSARLSDRVPFGTGPVLRKWMEGKEDLSKTYDFQAFIDLKALFSQKEQLFRINEKDYQTFVASLPKPVGRFLLEDHFEQEISDLNKNCSTMQSFNTRFFQKFNAFKILKYLNFSHKNFFQKAPLKKQQAAILSAAHLSPPE